MNSNTIIILLLVILIIITITDKKNEERFTTMYDNYATVNYNTRMDNGVETVVPRAKSVCKNKRMNVDDGDVRERYLARNLKLNQTIPEPNNLQNINNIDSNNNSKHRMTRNVYENLVDTKSLNSIMSDGNNSLNDIDNDLLSLN